MPIQSKNVFLVKCEIDVFESLFSKKKNLEVINYREIRNKMQNSDHQKHEPSDDVVQLQIIKKINTFKDCKRTETIYIHREKVDKDFIQKIKSLLRTSPFQVDYHLLHDGKMERGIKREFVTIKEI
jgi:hypothetical protein